MSRRLRFALPAAILHPVRLLPLTFAALILVGTVLLLLPVAHLGAGSAGFMAALFTSTSAVTVTGLSTVDTSSYWTPTSLRTSLQL